MNRKILALASNYIGLVIIDQAIPIFYFFTFAYLSALSVVMGWRYAAALYFLTILLISHNDQSLIFMLSNSFLFYSFIISLILYIILTRIIAGLYFRKRLSHLRLK